MKYKLANYGLSLLAAGGAQLSASAPTAARVLRPAPGTAMTTAYVQTAGRMRRKSRR